MKKKYRRAVYWAIILPYWAVTLPFVLMGCVINYIAEYSLDFKYWLVDKLKVSKYDPDRPATAEAERV